MKKAISDDLPARPRTKPPAVRREELMDAAERIFLEKGIGATSVDEIVLAADVAKGTFYLHFETKEVLLFALQERWVTSLRARLQAAVARRRDDDHRGRLRAWVEAGVDGYIDGAALHDLVFHEFRPEGPHAKHQNPIVTDLAQLLDLGTRASAWSVATPHLTAVMLFHALHGALDDTTHVNVNEGARAMSRKTLARLIMELFHRAVGLG